jgi:hypothetical protein
MKKIIAAVLCAVMLIVSGPFAYAYGTYTATEMPYTLKINGAKVNLGSLKVISCNGKLMVPLRLTAEAMGFKVTWNDATQSIHLGNGSVNSELSVGTDSYYVTSGTTKPTNTKSLGLPPILVGDCTYVPVNFYKILLKDSDCITVSVGSINIVTSGTSSLLTNALVSYLSVDEAKASLGFSPKTPTYLPSGYDLKYIYVISSSVLEIDYSYGSYILAFRSSVGSGDISGDSTTYSSTSTITVGSVTVTTKSNGSGIGLALWTSGDLAYSLVSGQGISTTDLTLLITSLS